MQVQEYEATPSMQLPPLIHGLEEHSFISKYVSNLEVALLFFIRL